MKILPILLAFLAMCSVPQHAAASTCGPRPVVVETLEHLEGFTRLTRGVAQGIQVLETWVSVEKGRYVILATDPAGESCIIAAGEALEIFPLATAGEQT